MSDAHIIAGRVGELNIVVAPDMPDNTMMVSQNTYDRIKEAFPEARHEIKPEERK